MDRKTILVVEDNSDELMIYSTLLSFRGYTILAAAGFDEAFRIATEQLPDLAVIDVNLGDPSRDGCDLVQALRDDERTRELPVIAHTAFGDVYRDSLERVGCASVIHKPSSPALLMHEIERVIGPGKHVDVDDRDRTPRQDRDPAEGQAHGQGELRVDAEGE
ncbi:MAG: response regulator [Longimicrobiales bacterium]